MTAGVTADPAVETSCDDTCAAVIGEDGAIRSNVISSQRAHDRFGGVVPEIASRHHLELIDVVVAQALARRRAWTWTGSTWWRPPRARA